MYNKLLKIAMYAIALNIFFTPLNGGIARLFGYMTILLTWAYPVVRTFIKRRPEMNIWVLILIGVVLFSVALNLGSFRMDNASATIISIVSFVVFYWSVSFDRDENRTMDLRFFFRLNYVLCAIFILYAFGPFDFKYTQINSSGAESFTMGLGNPNAVSGYVMFSIVLLIMQQTHLKKRVYKVLNLLLTGVILYILYLLSSRTVLACVLGIVVFVLVRRHGKMGRWIPYIAMLIPVLMISAQILLAEYDITVEILGKPLMSGRDKLYMEAIEEIRARPQMLVFGDIFYYCFENLHNAPLSILATLGISGLVMYWVFWLRLLRNLNRTSVGREYMIAYVCVLAYVVHSSSEIMFMAGAVPYCFFVLITVRIAKGEIRMPDTQNRISA